MLNLGNFIGKTAIVGFVPLQFMWIAWDVVAEELEDINDFEEYTFQCFNNT